MNQPLEAKACKTLLLRSTLTVAAAFLISLSFLTIPRQPYAIDDSLSEKSILSYAHEHGLQFGTDVIFTYGPLGFLTSRYFFPHGARLRMIVDLLLCLNVAAAVVVLALRLSAAWRVLILGLFIVLAANIDPRND